MSLLLAITSVCQKADPELMPITIPDYYVVAYIQTIFKDHRGQLTNNIRYRSFRMPLDQFGLQPPFKQYDDVPIPHLQRTYNLQSVLLYPTPPDKVGKFYYMEFVFNSNYCYESLWIPIPGDFYDPSDDLPYASRTTAPQPPPHFWTRFGRWVNFIRCNKHWKCYSIVGVTWQMTEDSHISSWGWMSSVSV